MLTTTLCAPLVDYMPGVRKAIVVDLPRKRLAYGEHAALAQRLQREGYGTRAGHAAHLEGGAGAVSRRHSGAHRLRSAKARFGLLNDLRCGERSCRA